MKLWPPNVNVEPISNEQSGPHMKQDVSFCLNFLSQGSIQPQEHKTKEQEEDLRIYREKSKKRI